MRNGLLFLNGLSNAHGRYRPGNKQQKWQCMAEETFEPNLARKEEQGDRARSQQRQAEEENRQRAVAINCALNAHGFILVWRNAPHKQ